MVKDLNLITHKPMLYICNVDEKSAVKGNNFSNQVKKKVLSENKNFILISASIESQIVEFENEKDRQIPTFIHQSDKRNIINLL